LSYLRSFPFDKIKIDRSFVAGLGPDNKEATAIVRAVTQMGSSLGMCTTAEGVETEDQLAAVRAEGCSEVQGYFFGKPKSAVDIMAWLGPGGWGPPAQGFAAGDVSGRLPAADKSVDEVVAA
jgi:EAL domain-containing protein (putative c-di-GMP-specific phosphodiesterase class I)